jgi:hypothetical protein
VILHAWARIAGLASAVGSRTMSDIENYNDEALLVDLVENAPLSGEASAVDAGELLPKRPTHASWIRQQWPGDELDGCGRHIMGEQFGECATSRRCRSEFVASCHEPRRPRSKARTASVPYTTSLSCTACRASASALSASGSALT